MPTAYLYDPIYLQHFQRGHIEGPERLDAINRALDESRVRERLTELKPQPIAIERLTRVHHAEYVARVKAIADRGGGGLMGRGDETYVAPRSYDAALLAAGAVVTGVEAVLRGDVPIWEDFAATVGSVQKLKALDDVEVLLSSWDDPRQGTDMQEAMEQSLACLRGIRQVAKRVAGSNPAAEPLELCKRVVAELNLPPVAANPLVARSLMAALRAAC